MEQHDREIGQIYDSVVVQIGDRVGSIPVEKQDRKVGQVYPAVGIEIA